MGWLSEIGSGLLKLFAPSGGDPSRAADQAPGESNVPVRGGPLPPVVQPGANQNAVAGGPIAGGPAHSTTPLTRPDVGLADRGVRPDPAERQETRAQYRERRSRERAIATLQRENPDVDRSDPANPKTVGHMHSRHGWDTSAADHEERVRTGLTPDGHQGPPAGRASWFRSPQAELEALRRGQRGFAADEKAGNLPEPPAVPNGDPLFHEVPVRTNDPRGFGNSAVVRRQAPPSNSLDKDAAGNRVAVPSSTVLPGASIRYKYDDAAKKWHLVSGFPEADPLPGGQPNLR